MLKLKNFTLLRKLNNKAFFLLSVILLISSSSMFAQTQDGLGPCTAKPFCSDSSYTFPNTYNAGTAIGGPNYGCLGSQPNAIWYYMQVGTAGTIQLSISQSSAGNSDIDFAMWGPFTDLASGCALVLGGQFPLQCSYSSAPTETIGIGFPGGVGTGSSTPPAAQVGEVYIVVLTNYGNNPGTISFSQTAGTGSADCGIVCGLTATNSGDVCLGQSVSMTAHTTDTVNTFTYYWSEPGGFTATGKVVNWAPTAPGTYNMTVIGVSGDNDTCTATTNFEVHPKPDMTLQDPNDKILCNLPGAILNLLNPSTVFTYQWYKDGVLMPGETNSNLNISENGDYKVSATSTFGCTDTSLSVNFQFNTTDADFTFHVTPGCNSDQVTFTNLSDSGKYFWNFGDGTPVDTNANPTHTYSQQGTYTVRLRVDGFNGCSDSMLVLINTSHPLEAAFTQNKDSVCQDETTPVQFQDQSIGEIMSWDWDFGDGSTSTLKDPTHNYTQAGVYQIRLIVSDSIPCSDTTYGTIYVDSIYQFTITSDKKSICLGEKINFNIEGFPDHLEAQWDFGDGSQWTQRGGQLGHSYESTGTFFPRVSVDFLICQGVSYDVDSVVVNDYPKVDLGQDEELCLNGNPIVLTNLTPNLDPSARYKWNTGDSTAAITVTHEGIYSLTVSSDGCTTTEEVEVKKDCYTDLPNAFTPNGDGENDYFYPRQLLAKGVTSFSMTIVNRWGQTVFESTSINGRGWDGKFNDKDQPMGVYIYQMTATFKNGRTESYTGNLTLVR